MNKAIYIKIKDDFILSIEVISGAVKGTNDREVTLGIIGSLIYKRSKKGIKMKKPKRIKRLIAIVLSSVFIVQGSLLSLETKRLPQNTSSVGQEYDTSDYSISVTPETAHYYLQKIAEVEKRAQDQIEHAKDFAGSSESLDFEYRYDAPPFIIKCVDIDGNGSDELMIYDRIPLAHWETQDGGFGLHMSDCIYFNIYSADGVVCSEYMDIGRHNSRTLWPYYVIAEPYVIGITTMYHDYRNYVTLYKMENEVMKKIDQRFVEIELDECCARYTDTTGEILHTHNVDSIPHYNLLQQILDKAEKLNVDFKNGIIVGEGKIGDDEMGLEITAEGISQGPEWYSNKNTKIIKGLLQSIADGPK